MNIHHLNTLTITEFSMLLPARFTPQNVNRSAAALAFILIAAVACSDRNPTAPPRSAAQHASRDINPGIDDLWISPHRQVIAGQSATGYLSLKAPAGPGGVPAVIFITHHSPWISPDTTRLVVAEGTSIQSFTIQTYAEPDTLGGYFCADLPDRRICGGSFTLLPTPPSSHGSPSPAGLSFPPQAVGTSSAAQTIVFRNSGTATLNFSGIAISGPFTQTNNCSATLAPNQSCTFWVSYVPTAAGPQSGSLTISSNADNSPTIVPLNGSGFVTVPGISVNLTSISFGGVPLGLATSGRNFRITSTGNAPLVVSSITLGGANPGDFLISSDNCSGVTLLPGASCTASVSFEPMGLGTRTARITIASNAPGAAPTISVSGTGTRGGPYIP